MGKNLVFCALAVKDGYQGSVNISSASNGFDVYLKNAFVALKSTRLKNPATDVGIVCNVSLPEYFTRLYEAEGIRVWTADYNEFQFPADNKWALALYKLCAMDWVLKNTDYEIFAEVDCDVLCNGSLDDLWLEAEHSLIMLSGPFTYSHPIRRQYEKAYEHLYGKRIRLIKWGSGLICASRTNMTSFMVSCMSVYDAMKRNNFCEDHLLGDEFITSAAVYWDNILIIDGKPYMDVYWTSSFYLASTNYKYDRMVFLHLPDEKERGIPSVFDYFLKKREFPPDNTLSIMLGLPPANQSLFRRYAAKILRTSSDIRKRVGNLHVCRFR